MNEFVARSGLLVAVVAITGFAIQQLLQLADPFVEAFIASYKAARARKGKLPLPNSMSEAEFKKSVMGFVAFVVGAAIAASTNLRVLSLLSVQNGTFSLGPTTGARSLQSVLDVIVSGFVMGAGTDGVNTLLKYIGYIKDARGMVVTDVAPRLPPVAMLGGEAVAGLPGREAPDLVTPATFVDTVGKVSVYYDQQVLGAQGLALARQLLTRVAVPYANMESYFGISGSAVDVVIVNLSGKKDGSGGSRHGGCDFSEGGKIYLDATFANTTVDPVDLAVGGYIAELSECFMGPQGRGWDCSYSNGEALSRYCAQLGTPSGTFDCWMTGPSWVVAGVPDFVTSSAPSDKDKVSIGCAVLYLFWMRSLGFTTSRIVQAGGANVAANYLLLTGKTTALEDLRAAVKPLAVTSDDPFT